MKTYKYTFLYYYNTSLLGQIIHHTKYICYQSGTDFMKDLGMSTCKLLSQLFSFVNFVALPSLLHFSIIQLRQKISILFSCTSVQHCLIPEEVVHDFGRILVSKLLLVFYINLAGRGVSTCDQQHRIQLAQTGTLSMDTYETSHR